MENTAQGPSSRLGLLLPFLANIKRFSGSAKKQEYLFSKWLDFVYLGGIGIIIVPLILIFSQYGNTEIFKQEVTIFTLYISFFLNYPHFTHSYQLLFSSYKHTHDRKQLRKFKQVIYIVPAIFCLVALIGFTSSQIVFFQILISIMFFTVGWHYVKQGYGVLILCCNINKVSFTKHERGTLLTICYSVWLSAFGLNNYGAASPESFGVSAINLKFPEEILFLLLLIATIATIEFIRLLISRIIKNEPIPNFVALSSFAVTIYIWMFFSNIAIYFLLVPALHSLQYLAITYKAKKNEFSGLANKNSLKFTTIGFISGIAFFYAIPKSMDFIFADSITNLSSELFSLTIISFINIHHYFIDSVIWKRDNRYLMGNLLGRNS